MIWHLDELIVQTKVHPDTAIIIKCRVNSKWNLKESLFLPSQNCHILPLDSLPKCNVQFKVGWDLVRRKATRRKCSETPVSVLLQPHGGTPCPRVCLSFIVLGARIHVEFVVERPNWVAAVDIAEWLWTACCFGLSPGGEEHSWASDNR